MCYDFGTFFCFIVFPLIFSVSQLSDIDITVDDVFCGTITGIVAKGASVEILCPEPLIGTLLKLQKTTYGPLNLAEVQIYSA